MLLNIDIPNSIDGSWYDGQVIAGLKEAVFEKSSAPRHATELHNILLTKMGKGVYSIVSYSYLFESQPRLPLCCPNCPPQFLAEPCRKDDVYPQSMLSKHWAHEV